MRRAVLLVLLFGLVTPAIADVPQQLHYNGYLTNGVGDPVECPDPIQCVNPIDVTFRIYASPEGGAPLWEEAYPGISVFAGSFHVLLGTVNPIDSELLQGEVWLSVKVNENVEMTPRQKIASSAFAIRAAVSEHAEEALNATKLGGVGAEQYVEASSLAPVATEGLSEGLADGDDDTLGVMTCAAGMVAKAGGDGSWVCDVDQVGGEDTTLNEAQVDEMVADNGYALQSALSDLQVTLSQLQDLVSELETETDADVGAIEAKVTALESALATLESSLGVLATGGLPTDLADGDDDTQLSELEVEGFVTNGPLNLASGSAIGDVHFAGSAMGVGVDEPKAALDVQGGVKIGNDSDNCVGSKAGTLRWTGSKFEGCDGSNWVSLVQAGACSGPFRYWKVTGGEVTYVHAPRSSQIRFRDMTGAVLTPVASFGQTFTPDNCVDSGWIWDTVDFYTADFGTGVAVDSVEFRTVFSGERGMNMHVYCSHNNVSWTEVAKNSPWNYYVDAGCDWYNSGSFH